MYVCMYVYIHKVPYTTLTCEPSPQESNIIKCSFGCVPTYQNVSKRIPTYQNVSKRIKTYQNVSKRFKTYSNEPKRIPTYSNVRRLV